MLHFAKWKIILVLLVAFFGLLAALPNLFSQKQLEALPEWLPAKQINLGLDLQGGAHLLYQMDEKALVEDWLKDIQGEVRDTLRADRIGYTGLRTSEANKSVTVRIRDQANVEQALTALEQISQPLNTGLVFTGQQGNTRDVSRNGSQITL